METARIADIADINPRVPRELAESPDREVNFVPMSHLSERGEITCNGTRPVREVLKGYTYFANGDVIVAKITPCMENGKAALVRDLPCGVAFGSTEFHVLRPRAMVEPRYLFYMLWNPAFRHAASQNMTGTAGQKRVPASFIQRFQIPLLSLGEQIRIADILDKAYEIHAKRREAVAFAKGLADAAFRQLFSARGCATSPHVLKTIGEIATVHGGIALSARREGHSRKVPYLRVANVYRGRLDLTQVKEIGVTDEEFKRSVLDRGDVLIVEGHGNRDEIGRAAVWDGSIDPCLHQNHLIRVKARRDNLSPAYLAAFLNSDNGRRQLFRLGKTTSGLNTINISQIRRTHLPVPSLEQQHGFEQLLAAQATIVSRLDCANDYAQGLFASLVERASYGDL